MHENANTGTTGKLSSEGAQHSERPSDYNLTVQATVNMITMTKIA